MVPFDILFQGGITLPGFAEAIRHTEDSTCGNYKVRLLESHATFLTSVF